MNIQMTQMKILMTPYEHSDDSDENFYDSDGLYEES